MMKLQIFMIPQASCDYTCFAAINVQSAFKKDVNYYQQVLNCKYIENELKKKKNDQTYY